MYPGHHIEFVTVVIFFYENLRKIGERSGFSDCLFQFFKIVYHIDAAGAIFIQWFCHQRKMQVSDQLRSQSGSGNFRKTRGGKTEFFEQSPGGGFVTIPGKLFRVQIAGKTCFCGNLHHTFQQKIGKRGENSVHLFFFTKGGDPVRIGDRDHIRFVCKGTCRTVWVSVTNDGIDAPGSGFLHQLFKFPEGSENQ